VDNLVFIDQVLDVVRSDLGVSFGSQLEIFKKLLKAGFDFHHKMSGICCLPTPK
jgi:hypothetical protein